MTARRALPDRVALAFWALLIGVVWLRVLALQHNVLNLHFDEAQYWAWSQSFAWGYFSKPPLIAWSIAGTTALFGDAEWAVRLAAPLAQGVAALALYALGRSIYGRWQGFWAGIGWLLMPAVTFSSGLITTDALLMPFWCIALFAFWRLIATRSWAWAIWLGLAIGLGALAKYAMLYFVLCALLAAWWAKPARDVVFSPKGAVAALIALAVLSPNLFWNAQNAFATVAHTASNAALGEFALHWGELGRFLIEHAIIGPIAFVIIIGLFIRATRRARGLSNEDHFLLAFIIPPLVVVATIALLSRVNANWAASAYPAATVWIAGSVFAWRRGGRLLALNALVNMAIAAVLVAVSVSPDLGDRFGFANAVKRVRGWQETSQEIALRAMAQPGEAPFTAVLVDDRATYFELAYYWRNARRAGAPLPPVRMWLLHGRPLNSAEQTDPMRPAEGARVLVVHARPTYLPLVAGDFTGFRTVEHVSIPLGGGKMRDFEISVGELFAPAPRDEAFEARIPD